MAYPIAHTLTDLTKKKVIRLVVVTKPGEYKHYDNFGQLRVETQLDYDSEDKNIYDTAESAKGYFTWSFMGNPCRFDTIENIDDKKVNQLIDEVKNLTE